MMKLKRILSITSIFMFLLSSAAFGAWQDVLEQTFDIVDTFDQLQDWHGEATNYVTSESQMPKKLDGSPSIWKMYSNWDTPKADWIRNHGEGYVWKGTKSLCINYNNLSTSISDSAEILGYGPSRMSTFFGDGISGKSGYKIIHVFYMIKFREGFFARNSSNDGWEYLDGYLKTLEICSGFTGVRTWGTADERAMACNNPQVRDEYGPNASVLNIIGGGSLKSLLCYNDTKLVANYTSDNCYHYAYSSTQYRNANIADQFLLNKWIGVEVIMNIGTVNNADGSLTINIYNDKGQLINSDSRTNETRLLEFDHYYNKITIGGNMDLSGGSATAENRFYLDDFIINDSEIAPTYFALLASQGEVANPVVEILTSSGQTTTASIFTITGTATADTGQTISGVTCSGQTVTPDDGVWDEQTESFTCLANLALGENTLVFIGSDGTRTGSDSIIINRTSSITKIINVTLQGTTVN